MSVFQKNCKVKFSIHIVHYVTYSNVNANKQEILSVACPHRIVMVMKSALASGSFFRGKTFPLPLCTRNQFLYTPCILPLIFTSIYILIIAKYVLYLFYFYRKIATVLREPVVLTRPTIFYTVPTMKLNRLPRFKMPCRLGGQGRLPRGRHHSPGRGWSQLQHPGGIPRSEHQVCL